MNVRISQPGTGRGPTRVWIVPAAVVLLVVLQARCAITLHNHNVWRDWLDQSRYLAAAQAWSRGDLTPALHHYPPGFALMAAPFTWLLPGQPFLIPDLLCAALSLILFAAICEHLSSARHTRALASACFLFATSLGRTVTALWAVPWTTTASSPVLLATLLLALRLASRQQGEPLFKKAACLGLVAGAGAMVRPADAAIVFLTSIAAATLKLHRAGHTFPALLRMLAAAGAGAAAGLLPFAIIHAVIFGGGAGTYAGYSAAIGFEWRLIPLHWVLLVVSPRPLLPEGTGMEAVFVWIWPGIAGMLASMAVPRRHAGANVIVAAAVTADWLLYLSYRDLQPYGLWRFNNVHYFKWTLPFFAFWSCRLAQEAAATETRRPALAAACLATLLFTWRAEFHATRTGRAAPQPPDTLTIPAPLTPIDRAIMVQASGSFRDFYFTRPNSLRIAGRTHPAVGEIKFFPGPGGGLLVPLRPLPDGDVSLILPAQAQFPPGAAWQAGYQTITFALPCFLAPYRGPCAPGGGEAWKALEAAPHA